MSLPKYDNVSAICSNKLYSIVGDFLKYLFNQV